MFTYIQPIIPILKKILIGTAIFIIALAWNILPVASYYQAINESNAYVQDGIMAYRESDYKATRTYFQNAIDAYPKGWWYNISPLFVMSFRAQVKLVRGMTLARHHATIADLYIKEERYDKAREYISKAFAYDNDNQYAQQIADKLSD